ncbi:N-acetylmuramoyl-L-alanine amidase [Salegentibacter chungangensis]|uniref:N-acetylmuramoyl-L-alanine amidase n=1 Tax=Salegentibacter chungangensis TaxID=1335724 RepID=A0ABW3NMU7_9FLAO
MRGIFPTLIIGLSVLVSCSTNPYRKTNRVYKKQAKEYAKELSRLPARENQVESALNYGEYRVGTTNFNLRKPNFVVIHHTAQDSVQQTLKTFTLPRTQVSAHYVIDDNGEVYHMLNDYYRAWHGGIGKWGNTDDLNSTSIGIELDNNGKEGFSEAQVKSLIDVLEILKEKYGIPTANFIGHSDIAPTRKVDPNKNFPWKELAEKGYGHWYDEAEVEKLQFEDEFFEAYPLDFPVHPELDFELDFLDELMFPEMVPSGFDYLMALRIIGYDISDPVAAVRAFKLHFIQENTDPVLSNYELKVLYSLYRKYL